MMIEIKHKADLRGADHAIGDVSRLSRIMWDTAAMHVADYLARRAANKLEG